MKTLITSRWNRILTVSLSAVLVGIGLLFSGTATAQDDTTIVGSIHDFSDDGWSGTTEICVVCHTPHNALTESEANAGSGQLGPLWNRTLTAVTNYSLYTSLTRVGSDIDAIFIPEQVFQQDLQ